VHSIIQDETGATERLALYNTNVAAQVDEILPEDAILAIKEPYYSASANSINSLRVDHPSDLVRLYHYDNLVPGVYANFIEADRSALDWKKEGNAAYSTGSHIAALHAYSQGLDACSFDDIATKHDLLRNRGQSTYSSSASRKH